jgi:hypothetical protein
VTGLPLGQGLHGDARCSSILHVPLLHCERVDGGCGIRLRLIASIQVEHRDLWDRENCTSGECTGPASRYHQPNILQISHASPLGSMDGARSSRARRPLQTPQNNRRSRTTTGRLYRHRSHACPAPKPQEIREAVHYDFRPCICAGQWPSRKKSRKNRCDFPSRIGLKNSGSDPGAPQPEVLRPA